MRFLIPLLLLCALMAAACGSDSPTDPGDGGGNNTGGFEDTPAIPRPSSPGGSVSSRSEVLTIIASPAGELRAAGHRRADLERSDPCTSEDQL